MDVFPFLLDDNSEEGMRVPRMTRRPIPPVRLAFHMGIAADGW